MDDGVRVAIERRTDTLATLRLSGRLRPGWCGRLATGLASRGVDIASGRALNVTAGDSVRHAFTSFFQYGVLEKLPELKLVVLECGATWIGYWLDRMDSTWHSPQGAATRQILPEKPSEYFKRQCWISADPDERSLPGVMEVVGEDRFFWASDFPHPDHPPEYLPNLEQRVAGMSDSARSKLLGENVRHAYGLT